MKHIKLLSVALLCLFFSSCGISRQKALIENLGKCRFDLQSVEQVSIAGNSWNRLIGEDGINLNAVPSIALNLLRAGARYYVYKNLNAGVSIKAHMGKADYIEWSLGYTLNRDK